MSDTLNRLDELEKWLNEEPGPLGVNTGRWLISTLRASLAREQKLREALEKISCVNKPIGLEGHGGPESKDYWFKQELMSRDIAYKALEETSEEAP